MSNSNSTSENPIAITQSGNTVIGAINKELYLVDNLDTGVKGVYGFKEALNIYSLCRRLGNKVTIEILKDPAAKILYASKDSP